MARPSACADGYEVAASREALFAEADVLSLHVRLVKETRGMVTVADPARMQPGAVLANTSRAELIAEGALAAALRAGRLAAWLPRPSTCSKANRCFTRSNRCCNWTMSSPRHMWAR